MARSEKQPAPKGRRSRNNPWKRIYGKDRKYTARVDRAKARGQHTENRTPLT